MFTLTIKKSGEVTHGPSIFESMEALNFHFENHGDLGSYGEDFQVEIEDTSEAERIEKESREALDFLNSTDYKVLRHIRQKNLAQKTTLSEEEYLALEIDRSYAASRVKNKTGN